ncbi:hypothetical protein WN55_05101 [Dufourea novaeangliae]|uniref:Uncharacterized protein n=1 Tax=Dufourea novaeangliae TaxID=178035 RepID=A0A154PNW2_DUFNO|nr:hypothetical protein WN55_05101 [Dufourea novaeangliae]
MVYGDIVIDTNKDVFESSPPAMIDPHDSGTMKINHIRSLSRLYTNESFIPQERNGQEAREIQFVKTTEFI